PMPKQNILPATGVPIPFNFLPQLCDFLYYVQFPWIIWVKVSLYGQQPLYHKSRFHQVSAIVFIAERNGRACISIQPMWQHAMKPVCPRKKINNFRPSFHRLLAGDKSSFDTHNDGHYSKTRPSDGNQVAGGVPFPGKATVFMGKIPKIFECLPLHQGEQLVIRYHREFGRGIYSRIK